MRLAGWWVVALLVWPAYAVAGEVAPTGDLHAVRTPRPIELDGKVDEPQWQAAPVFDNFVVSYPNQGAKPSQKTEVRVLFDDDNLYVSFVCHDTEPSKIVANLDRRDNLPSYSDWVLVALDPSHDRRTANWFAVNAAGVMKDQLYYDDTHATSSWDAVWDAAVARRPDGWSAEFSIPLSVLRFPKRHEQSWGILVERNIPRGHEQIDSVLIPRASNAYVSLFGTLNGLVDLNPRPDLELKPYAAARATVRPRYDAADRPQPRIVDPALDLGLDLQSALTSRLTLNAAINPDFGEVNPDALILNLGNTEAYFSEQRTFFNQGLELFQPLSGGGSGTTPFYSRRIGLDAPILGAAKLVGGLGENTKLGVLEAVVLGVQDQAKAPYAFEGLDTDQAPLDRTWQYHPQTPFHFGPNDELPAERAASMNFFAVVGRQKVLHNSALGATFTAATPLGQLCYPSDFFNPNDYDKDTCAALGGNGLSLESNLTTDDGDWGLRTQLNGSQLVGGPSSWTRRDGVHMYPGALGWGAFVQGGKFGGEPWVFNTWYVYDSPRLDMNPSGFQPDDDFHELGFWGAYNRPNGFGGSLHSFELSYNAWADISAEGKHVPRVARMQSDISWTFANYFFLLFELGWEINRFDQREINHTGIAFQRRNDAYIATSFNTDSNKPFSLSGGGDVFKTASTGPLPSEVGYGANGGLSWRPVSSLSTSVNFNFNHNPQGARFVDDLGGDRYVFGALYPGLLSVTLNASWVFMPRLTLQGYAQFFSAYGDYGPFYTASAPPGGEIRLSQLVPTPFTGSNPDFHESAVNLNIVLRWEYRLGSTFFLVYSRNQQELPLAANAPVTSLSPNMLGRGRTTETFLVKYSYWWDV